jgi:pimeloyl-ACP methyl ester carboxylesterase
LSTAIEPFEIRIPEEVLTDLRERLARTRYPDQIEGSGWDYGTDGAYLKELCEYWREKFDWRTQEAQLNRFPQFLSEIDGQRIHFIHRRSPVPEALPLVLTHGWPGSILLFYKVIDALSDPESHGGSPQDAFHVICPSLPGYAWSGPTGRRGWDVRRVAETWAKLMERLGYARYGAQGGDWGAVVTTHLGLVDPEHVCGIHLNMVVAGPPSGDADPAQGLSPDDLQAIADMADFQKHETGYQEIQGTKPQTLGVGLNDSPAGLAAWIVEKFRAWSDCGGDVESRFSKDELLTNITIYWATQTINSSTRLYYETKKGGHWGVADYVGVPTGCAIFPKEIFRPPRNWAEACFNVVHWQRFDRGGHFAALEEPGLLVDDVRTFFRRVR